MGIQFAEIESILPDRRRSQPGLYEVHTNSGLALKVGISGDLRSRLRAHRASRQSGLKLRPDGSWDRPEDVTSKKSVLAKHLYYDRSITTEFDLRTESGRRLFLAERCFLIVEFAATRPAARAIEIARERSGLFRYVGNVVIR